MSTRLDEARQALGHELGGWFRGSALGGSTTTITTTIAALKSSELADDELAYAWAYMPNGVFPKLRRVTETGLNGSTGVVTVDAAFGGAVTIGDIFELSAKLPPSAGLLSPFGEARGLGMNEAINLALRHLLVPREDLTVTLVNGQYDYSVSTWEWLDRKERLKDVREPNVTGQNYRSTTRPWELRERADGNILHFDKPYRFATGSYTAQLVAMCPADRYILSAGGWADTIYGLVTEGDEAGPDTNAIVAVALAFCYRELRDVSTGQTQAEYADLYTAQVREARKARNYDHTNDIDPSVSAGGPVAAPAAAGAA